MRKIYLLLLPALLCSLLSFAVCTNTGVALSATTSITDIYCTSNDGTITVSAINGWVDAAAANGTGYAYALTAGPLTRPTQSSNIFSALPAGTYTVTVTDCHGSLLTLSATVGGTAPAALSYSPVVYKSVCANNNGIKLNPSGGRAPYTVTVISAPPGSGTPVVKGDTIYNLAAGSLSAQITDACGTTLGLVKTISTIAPLAPSSSLGTRFSILECAGAGGASTPTITYSFGFPDNVDVGYSVLVVDSFWTELWFGGVLKETKTHPGYCIGQFYSPTLTLGAYGSGVYRLRTFAKCAGLIKTDSIIVGNRPSNPTGSNSNLAEYNAHAWRSGCTDFDFGYSFTNTGASGAMPLGQIVDVMMPNPKMKVLSGASHVGDSSWSGRLNNLSYSSVPYVIEFSDTCGNRDTVYYTNAGPVFTKRPTGTIGCNFIDARSSDYISAPSLLGGSSVPWIYPVKVTFLSGTGIDYTSYPFSIVDSVGSITTNASIPMRSNGSVTVAYENACGQKDTTVWTASCPPVSTNTLSISVDSKCGNRADLTFAQTSPSVFVIYPFQSPSAETNLRWGVDALSYGESSHFWPSVSSGTYKMFMVASRGARISPSPASSGIVPQLYLNGYSLVSGDYTSSIGYPISVGGDMPRDPISYHAVINWSGPIDTSKLRAWDTTFTVVVDSTVLRLSATESYLCKDGVSGATIMARGRNGLAYPGLQYSLSSTSASGPWSAAQRDSLLTVTGLSGSTPIWVRVTDTCGSSATANTTLGYVVSATLGTCGAGDIATVTPNPYTSSFIYQLKNPSGVITTYAYGSPITIDLSTPANAGTYYLYYRLASGGTTGCVVDSVKMIATSPCMMLLPLSLLSFDARLNNGVVQLNWSASETAIAAYEVQRSYDGRSWSSLRTLSAYGDGTHSYSCDDADPGSVSTVYYRLRILEKDGGHSYSAVIPLKLSPSSALELQVLPNPAKQQVNIQVKGAVNNAQLSFTDALGRVTFMAKPLTEGSNIIDISSFAPGVYWARIVHDGAVLYRQFTISE